MLITTANVKELDRGFSKIFESSRTGTPEFGSQVAMTIPSVHKTEIYSFMKRLLAMREWVGPRLIDNLENYEYLLTNKKYEKTIGVPVDDIEDDNLGVYDIKFQEMGRLATKWPDQLIKTVMQNGTTALGFDGQPFFSTTHDLDPDGNQSNNFTSTALNANNFNTVWAAMASYTGEDGEPLGVMPTRLVVPPQLFKAAKEIVSAGLVGGGDTNVQQGMAEVIVVPELANEPTVWYLMDVATPVKPFLFQLRQAPRLTAKTALTDDNVFEQDQFLWGMKARGVAGYGPWWLCARCIA